jgi:mRNA-degrading endonuclease RelE of RelBE toxin-antitoxin system
MAGVAPEISFDREFLRSVNALTPNDGRQVWKAVDRLAEDPNHPGLHLKLLRQGCGPGLYSARAALDLRILLTKAGNTIMLFEAGKREQIYEGLDRKRVAINQTSGRVALIAPRGGTAVDFDDPTFSPPDPVSDERPALFDHWSDAELAEAGFTPSQVLALRSCRVEDDLCELDWDDEDFDLAVELLGLTPEQWRNPPMVPDEDADERALRQLIEQFGAAHGISPLFDAAEVAKIAAAPIEDWMVFLHPEQRNVVDRSYDGPARVRGSAGTGKTVVALHRAAALAHRYRDEGPILFTTFINTLPPVFEQLYGRLPNSIADAVEFKNLDKLTRAVCAQAGYNVALDMGKVNSAYASAWNKVAVEGSPIKRAGLTRQYVRDEITSVIKGRAIQSIDLYLGLERTGRRTRFGEPLRRQVWDLMVRWDAEMHERGTIDFVDIVRQARDIARQDAQPRYRAAIIDESQDISLVGLQFVCALVNGSGIDRSDGLLLVGDGAQRIYPGGFTLRQAGIEVGGRATVLKTNYRNTAAIIGAAMAVAGRESVDDLGEEYHRGDEAAEAIRSGGFVPRLVACSDESVERKWIVDTIRQLENDGVMGLGDIAIFVPTNRQVDEVIALLKAEQLTAIKLDKYDGRTTPEVKVGTFHRAKGLEFKAVFLPGVTNGVFPRPQDIGQDNEEYAEQRALAIAQLFVAMTRARDALFVLCSGDPTPEIENALAKFEVVNA